MKLNLTLIALPALFALAACGSNEPEVLGSTQGDPMSDELNNAGAVELPPMVKHSATYRCKDSSLVYVDFMSDDKTAMVRTEKTGTPTTLTSAEAGKPFVAEGGYSVSGTGDQVTIELPGKGSLSCKS
ncbi:MAG: hypothetical protein E2598_04465 [Sphingobium sp.]|nr:hypothetical protein [Sphingobium sp.]